MFQLAKIDSVKWPVIVNIPQDGGKTKDARFTAEFRVMEQSETNDMIARCRDDAEFLSEVILSWEDDFKDADGEPLAFSKDQCLRAANIPYVRRAMLRSFWEAQHGNAAKN